MSKRQAAGPTVAHERSQVAPGKAVSSDAPLVTIVIPFFNVGPFLAEAIESVLAQTFTDWELLLVDDGGIDESRAIADSYCLRFPERIRCLEHPNRSNRGISAARNRGWREARGELVSFLDGDDAWYPDKLQRQVAIFLDHPEVDLCIGATLYWHQWPGSPSHLADYLASAGGPANRVIGPGELVKIIYPLGKGRAPSMNTVVVRNMVRQKAGMFEEEFPGAFEDQAFLIKVYLTCNTFISDAVLDRYRQRRSNSSTALELEGFWRHRPHIVFYKWLVRYFRALGPAHEAHARLASRRLWEARKKWLAQVLGPVRRWLTSLL